MAGESGAEKREGARFAPSTLSVCTKHLGRNREEVGSNVPSNRATPVVLPAVRRRDARLYDLEQELELLRKTLPPAAILQELRRATPQEVLDIVEAVGRAGEEKLLTFPEEVKSRYAALLGIENGGAARVVERGKYDRVTNLRGGGRVGSSDSRTV